MDELSRNKRNFIFLTMEGTFYFFGLTFLDANTVVPLFVDTYTGSLQLAGLANTLRMVLTLLPQLLIGPYVRNMNNLPTFVLKIMIFFRPLFFLMVPVLFFSTSSSTIVIAFLIIYSLFWISEGIISIPWLEVFSRTIAGNKRGKLLGLQQFFSGIAGIAGGFIIKIVLQNSHLQNSIKFSILFGIAAVLLLFSALSMIPIKDNTKIPKRIPVNLRKYFGQLPSYMSANKEFAAMSIVQLLASFTLAVIPFIILFCKDTFSLNSSQVSSLIYLQIIGTLFGGILWGSLSHRLGNKYLIMIAQFLGFVIYILALTAYASKAQSITYLLELLSGIYLGSWIGFINYIIDVVDENVRPVYFALSSVVILPSTLFPYFNGVIAGTWGFTVLFAFGTFICAFAIIMSFRLKSLKQIMMLKE